MLLRHVFFLAITVACTDSLVQTIHEDITVSHHVYTLTTWTLPLHNIQLGSAGYSVPCITYLTKCHRKTRRCLSALYPARSRTDVNGDEGEP